MTKKKQRIFGSQILSDSTPPEGGSEYWRALFYLNIYRMLLAVFLVTSSLATINVGSLGSKQPLLFFYASITYALLSVFFAIFIHKGRPHYVTQCRIQLLTDILIIILLYHASGGRGAGLEILLFITVSASGILLGGRGALATASTATILLILAHFYTIITHQRPLGGFTTLGLIGSGLFVTAFAIYYLSILLRKTEIEVAQQNLDLKKLGHLNEIIVEQLNSGVIVIDHNQEIILINQSGTKLLGIIGKTISPLLLKTYLPELAEKITSDNRTEQKELKIKMTTGLVILAHYKPVNLNLKNAYIILLDDFSRIEQKQRNEKFIAMGRLSASIAHEIRNPLGAISHAGQLLAESPSITNDDSRLVEIIETQSQRINRIIQTILELGQTNELNVKKIALHNWLSKIIEQFVYEKGLAIEAVRLKGSKSALARGDPDQLQHVILNLLLNSLRFANTNTAPFVTIEINNKETDDIIQVTVSDNGPGIAQDIRENIFEPFFTTSSTGNGLGLYIARKICLSNHGYLDYISDPAGDGFFKISLKYDETCQST